MLVALFIYYNIYIDLVTSSSVFHHHYTSEFRITVHLCYSQIWRQGFIRKTMKEERFGHTCILNLSSQITYSVRLLSLHGLCIGNCMIYAWYCSWLHVICMILPLTARILREGARRICSMSQHDMTLVYIIIRMMWSFWKYGVDTLFI